MQTTRGGIVSFGPTVIDSMLLASVTSTSIGVTGSSMDGAALSSVSFAMSSKRSISDDPLSTSGDFVDAVVASFTGSGVDGETSDEKKGDNPLPKVALVKVKMAKRVKMVKDFILGKMTRGVVGKSRVNVCDLVADPRKKR